MSQNKGSIAAVLLSTLSLSGCFVSDTPLITAFDSVTPVPEGRYTYVDTDKSTKSVIITRDGSVTLMTSINNKGSAKIDRLLMQELGQDFYIVMDALNNYTLISVKPEAILEFDGPAYCEQLLGLARSAGKGISEYGVVQVDRSGTSPHCKFDDLDKIKRAMAALANSGTKLPSGATLVNGLVLARIYRRQ